MARSKVWTGTEWAYEDVVGGTGASWGSITGTLSNQTDLNTALANKQNKVSYGTTAPTNPADGDIWVNPNGGSGGGGGSDWHTYSTTEHAVGTWIDGKTIYEKTYHYTNYVFSVNVPTDLENLSSLNIDTIVNLGGMFVTGNNGETYALGDLFAGDYTTVRYVASQKYLIIVTNQALYSPLTTLDVTIQYTKAGE